jgi:hypothetical protein
MIVICYDQLIEGGTDLTVSNDESPDPSTSVRNWSMHRAHAYVADRWASDVYLNYPSLTRYEKGHLHSLISSFAVDKALVASAQHAHYSPLCSCIRFGLLIHTIGLCYAGIPP